MSVVLTRAQPEPRPEAYPKKDEREPDSGWVVYVDPLATELAVTGHAVQKRLRPGTATLDANGQVNRKFLTELSSADAAMLASMAGRALPPPDSLAGRPWDEAVDPQDATDGWRWGKYRREQAALRDTLLEGNRVGVCAICGLTWPPELLVAAHIKPRRDCTEEERRDYGNVAMLLCAMGCDVLFEWGFVIVDSAGTIRRGRPSRNSALSERVKAILGRRCGRHNALSAPYFAARREALK